MTDDLVKRWDDYVESMGSVMGDVEHMAQQMRDRIEALTAEHNATLARLAGAVAREIALTADNTRLRKSLQAIADEASVPVHTWKNGINFKKMCAGWRKIATERIDIARAALNAGKEPSHE